MTRYTKATEYLGILGTDKTFVFLPPLPLLFLISSHQINQNRGILSLVDSIVNPTGALQDLCKELEDATAWDAFPEQVASHFSGIFVTHIVLADVSRFDL